MLTAACASELDRERHATMSAVREIGANAYGSDGPGGAIIAVRNGEVLVAEGFGSADLEWQEPMSADTALRIGSLTKSFTAIVVLRMAERSEVSLDRSVGDYVSDLPPQFAAPTIRQLLSHTSGLPDHFYNPQISAIARNPTTARQIIEIMAQTQPLAAPGETWSYGNFNYVLLGLLIEQISGRPYADVIRTEIFEPLSMTNSHYDDPSNVIARRAQGYDTDGDDPINTPAFHPSLAFAAGAMLSSANDLGRWGLALRAHTLLTPQMAEEAFTPATLRDGSTTEYGLGFNIGTFRGQRVIWHSGSTNGFNATYFHALESDAFVAVLSNGFYLPNTTTVARRILARLDGIDLPNFAAQTPSPEAISNIQGRYTLSDGRTLQIHVQDGVRFNFGSGDWTELEYAGDDTFFIEDFTGPFEGE